MKTENKAAFARPWSKIKQNPDAPDQVSVAQSGMTLREYFAAKAMQGLLTITSLNDHDCEVIAKHAVNQADALIRALVNEA